MFSQDLKNMNSKLICPECKNEVDMSRYPNLAIGMVVECNHCGMTLAIKEVGDNEIKSEIVDEGK
jgi:ribosomal protein S27E